MSQLALPKSRVGSVLRRRRGRVVPRRFRGRSDHLLRSSRGRGDATRRSKCIDHFGETLQMQQRGARAESGKNRLQFAAVIQQIRAAFSKCSIAADTGEGWESPAPMSRFPVASAARRSHRSALFTISAVIVRADRGRTEDSASALSCAAAKRPCRLQRAMTSTRTSSVQFAAPPTMGA